MSFYDRYSEMCQKRKIHPTSSYAANCLECDRSYLSKLRSSGATPNGEIIARAAVMLNVTSDYLLGITDDAHPVHLHYSEAMSAIEVIIQEKRLNALGISAAESMITGLATNDAFVESEEE